MHASCNESSLKCECLYTVEKDKLRALRSSFKVVFSKFKAMLADYLAVEPSALDESQAIEQLERKLAILDSKSDQPLQQEDVRVLLDSLKLSINLCIPLYRAPSTLDQTFSDLSTLSQDLLDKVIFLQKELDTCKEEIQSLKENNQSLYEDFSDLSYGIRCSEDRNCQKEIRITDLEEELAYLRDKNRTIKGERASLRDENRTMKTRINYLEEEFASLKHYNSIIKERLQTVKIDRDDYMDRYKRYKRKANSLKCRDYITKTTDGILKQFVRENPEQEGSTRWKNLSNQLKNRESNIYRLLKQLLRRYNMKVSNFEALMKERFFFNSTVHETLPIKRARDLEYEDTSFKYISHKTFQKCIRAYEELFKNKLVRKIDEDNI